MAPSTPSEELLDVEQITLQDSVLSPPNQTAAEPGLFRLLLFLSDPKVAGLQVTVRNNGKTHPHMLAGLSDSDAAVMNPDPADVLDRLDVSTSSIDMTNTSLAMHEEKEGDISGIGM